ncbi:hypothetical protein Pla108_26840 [Botrimarina colliarenosi]|uniref:Uncharacterized protein n=1 Tax=Botrimarina colliarenosi TaxID=2528001 RepID=A0A5C6AC55_9BACT|nr:hypothetical protein [Botrimarina colliarenosi]TWT96908.1 hypothetical protein Pla108_26840 [Botrimarina colliarenosi]
MSNQTSTQNEPITRLKDGLLQIAIWKNESEKGRPFYSTSAVQRSYKDDNGNYHETTSLSGSQLLQASRLYALAYDQVRELEEADYQASKQ